MWEFFLNLSLAVVSILPDICWCHSRRIEPAHSSWYLLTVCCTCFTCFTCRVCNTLWTTPETFSRFLTFVETILIFAWSNAERKYQYQIWQSNISGNFDSWWKKPARMLWNDWQVTCCDMLSNQVLLALSFCGSVPPEMSFWCQAWHRLFSDYVLY